ncbi:hypothetical protein Y032_0326g2561 [Ancylostoma ceylanicum]|uniref:Uncharacterized protein n=1 Tax=Ancylostoma ceylanicum TaxID=53326 RepID=A0A016S092_9BILA|nr:hypothetical protein Y032_0326g2561 [Ancylostoma ceylanicum]
MIDGKIEDVQSGAAMVLWGNTLLRGAVRTHMRVQEVEKDEKPEETPEEETKTEAEEPVVEPKGEYGELRLILLLRIVIFGHVILFFT